MRVKAEFIFWVLVICATGFLVGSQSSVGATKPAPACSTRSIEFTVGFDGVDYAIQQVKVCRNGEIFLAGRRVVCRKSAVIKKRVGGGVVMTSAIVCK